MAKAAKGSSRVGYVAGRQALPRTEVPNWVAWADGHKTVVEMVGGRRVKRQETTPGKPCNVCHSLYVKAKMHVFRDSPTSEMWSKSALADMCGMETADNLDPHLNHLRDIGAMDWRLVPVSPSSTTFYNVYVIHEMPPEGYPGPVSLAEYYERRKGAIEAMKAAARAKTQKSRDKAKALAAGVAAEQLAISTGGVTGSDPLPAPPAVTGSNRLPVTGPDPLPVTGSDQTPVTGCDPLEPTFGSNHLEGKPPTTPAPPDGQPDQAPGAEGRQDQSEGRDEPPKVTMAVLDGLLRQVPDDRRPTPSQLGFLADIVGDRLTAGWTPKQLGSAIDGNLRTARSVYAAVKYRLEQLGDPPKAARPPSQRSASGCVVAECDSHHNGPGRVEYRHPGTGRDRLRPCHNCQPSAYAAWLNTDAGRQLAGAAT